MNKDLQSKLSQIESMIATQKDCIPFDKSYCRDYMHGMANGMILIHSIITDSSPRYVESKRRNGPNIRHKCKGKR